MKKVPTFFIDGILDSGKTTYIVNTLKSDTQAFRYKSLVVVCEEGEVEFDKALLKEKNAEIRFIETMEEFNGKALSDAIKEVKPDRLIIEMNGMWDVTALKIPSYLDVLQSLYFVDATTFPVYFNNMRQKFNDQIIRCNAVCFTKVDDPKALAPYQNALRLINKNAAFLSVGEDLLIQDVFEEPLPYDIDAPVVDIKDEDYVTFYIDAFDHRDRYKGKVVEFDCETILSDDFTDHCFIAGRFIMNCCANDIQLYGLVAKPLKGYTVKDKGWAHIKGTISYEWSDQYNEEEMVITPTEMHEIPAKEEVLNMTANNNNF